MWDGRFRTLEQQATSSFLRGEMGIDIREAERRLNSDAEYLQLFQAALNSRPSASGMAIALAAYQRTLISETSRFDRFVTNNRATYFTELELNGLRLFERKAGCGICHQFQQSVNNRVGPRMFKPTSGSTIWGSDMRLVGSRTRAAIKAQAMKAISERFALLLLPQRGSNGPLYA